MKEIKVIKILGEDFQINFPNVSDFLQIEALKHTFSNGNYDQMKLSSNKQTKLNVMLIEALSVFQTLIPDLKKKIGTSIALLSMSDSISLVTAYKKEYLPWFSGLMNKINEEFAELMKDDD